MSLRKNFTFIITLFALSAGLQACQQIRSALFRYWITPGDDFGAASHPPPPDYGKVEHWAALPDRKDLSDRRLPGQAPGADLADVFYVHPTTYFKSDHWHDPLAEKEYQEDVFAPMRNQASVFNECCRVYAPRYRQATLASYFDPANGNQARDLAYTDVLRAFDTYMQRYNQGRPIIIAGHSQGTDHGLRLLEDRFAGKPLARKLVVAYLPGRPIPFDKLPDIPGIPLCRSASQIRCLISWNTMGYSADPRQFFELTEWPYKGRYQANGQKKIICTNPVSWRVDEKKTTKEGHLGAVFFKGDDISQKSRLTGAVCQDGILRVDKIDLELDTLGEPEGYHIFDINFFYKDIRQNLRQRLEAYNTRKTGT